MSLQPLGDRLRVECDEASDEWLAISDDHALADEPVRPQSIFYDGRRNILATGRNEKLLLSACDKQIAFRVELTNVASVEPAIAIDSFAGGSLVVVVTLKDMWPLNQNLAIFCNSNSDTRDRPTNGTYLDERGDIHG